MPCSIVRCASTISSKPNTFTDLARYRPDPFIRAPQTHLAGHPNTVDHMSVQSVSGHEPAEPYEVIHLGGEAAAIVPLAELRRLRAVEQHASPEALEEAEIEATLAAHDEWVAAGCPGARSHEDVMAELLGSDP